MGEPRGRVGEKDFPLRVSRMECKSPAGTVTSQLSFPPGLSGLGDRGRGRHKRRGRFPAAPLTQDGARRVWTLILLLGGSQAAALDSQERERPPQPGKGSAARDSAG